jgi:hypothetical protein
MRRVAEVEDESDKQRQVLSTWLCLRVSTGT